MTSSPEPKEVYLAFYQEVKNNFVSYDTERESDMEQIAIFFVTVFACYIVGNALAKKFPASNKTAPKRDFKKEFDELSDKEREEAIETYLTFKDFKGDGK